jgi:hypothetical protein
VTGSRSATRLPGRLEPDPSRVLAQLFVPGHALAGSGEGRASGLVDHILGLSDGEVADTLSDIEQRFGGRHRELTVTFSSHADRIRNRLAPDVDVSPERWRDLHPGVRRRGGRAVQPLGLPRP